MRQQERKPVVVVGCGPVGAVCALALWREGVPIIALEAEPQPVKDQRAASTQPSTMEILASYGLYDRIIARSLVSPTFRFFDRLSGDLVCEFDCGLLKDDTRFPFVVQHEQFKLVDTILDLLRGEAGFEVRFSTRYLGHRQEADRVLVTVGTEEGEETIEASYLVGCDGGRSQVRKDSGLEFTGFTYPERFVKIGTTFDFLSAGRGFVYRNYFSDPEEWCNLFKVAADGPPGVWRAVFPTRIGETDEEALGPEGVERRLHKFFPGFSGFEVAYKAIYTVSQCVAESFRRGRVLIAGDAAHINNPIGGLGMNGGIQDAATLAPILAAVWHGAGDDGDLDRYTRQRRQAQHDFVQAQTIRNKQQLEERDPAKRRQHLDQLRRTAETPELARQFLLRATLIESVRTAAAIQ
jgi:3-(3-hydroxy-phenyl)propionate hydroxylase